MYYMSVNPVNSAMIKAYGGTYRTEAQVAALIKVYVCHCVVEAITILRILMLVRHFRSMDGSVTSE